MKSKVISVILITFVIVNLFCLPVIASGENSSDYAGHWAQQEIMEWLNTGLVKGYDEKTFKPDQEVTRAEFIAFVNRAFGFTKIKDVKFSDVPGDAWYAEDVKKALAAGYINGYEDGTLRPGNLISRVETAKIIADLIKIDTDEKSKTLESFNDSVNVPQWGSKQLFSLAAQNYYKGSADGWIQPYKNVTRAETVVLLYRAKGGKVDESKIPQIEAVKEFSGALYTNCCKDKPNESKKCLLMPGCASKGYGINVHQTDGSYKFYQFDEHGQEFAKKILDSTAKDTNIAIQGKFVEGVLPDKVLKVLELGEDKGEGTEKPNEENNNLKKIKISGMSCEMCVNHITNTLKSIDGVEVVSVEVGSAVIKLNKAVDTNVIIAKIKDSGYTVVSIS